MRHHQLRLWAAVALAAIGLTTAGCSEPTASAADGHTAPAVVEAVAGTDLSSVTLTEHAAERLGIETAPVAAVAGARTQIPYGALLYDAAGGTWAFTNPEPLVFVRAAVTVVSIGEDTVVLSAGPPVGTQVVTVGAAELYGAELGVGH